MPPVQGTMIPSRTVNMTPGTAPYVGSGAKTPAKSQQPSILGAQAVRATGTGPFDAAYRQDLATYAGGQFQRPGGVLSFNPTAQQGQPGALGGVAVSEGNAPLQGSPTDLLSLGLAGQGYAPQTPRPATTTNQQAKPLWQQPGWQQWLNNLTNQGRLLRGY